MTAGSATASEKPAQVVPLSLRVDNLEESISRMSAGIKAILHQHNVPQPSTGPVATKAKAKAPSRKQRLVFPNLDQGVARSALTGAQVLSGEGEGQGEASKSKGAARRKSKEEA